MIVKLKFDIFYTTVKIPDISEEELKDGLYNQLKKWIKRQQCYRKMYYNDDAVIQWINETKLHDEKAEVLEKAKNIDEPSNYSFDTVLYF